MIARSCSELNTDAEFQIRGCLDKSLTYRHQAADRLTVSLAFDNFDVNGVIMPNAPNACMSCFSKKRRCDRLLPRCSRCNMYSDLFDTLQRIYLRTIAD
jgi:hypothetical protein